MNELIFQETYTFDVFWHEPDEEYVATCRSFPSLSCLDPDPATALRDLQLLLAEEITLMHVNGEEIPSGNPPVIMNCALTAGNAEPVYTEHKLLQLPNDLSDLWTDAPTEPETV